MPAQLRGRKGRTGCRRGWTLGWWRIGRTRNGRERQTHTDLFRAVIIEAAPNDVSIFRRKFVGERDAEKDRDSYKLDAAGRFLRRRRWMAGGPYDLLPRRRTAE